MRKRSADPIGTPLEANLLLSVDEAAAMMSLGRTLVYALVRRGEIASFKVGRMRRIPVSALRDYVQQRLIEDARGVQAHAWEARK